MKALLNSLLFVIAAGYAAAEIASAAGVNVPAAVNAPNAAVALLVTGLLALWVADYSRKPRLTLTVAATRRMAAPVSVPAPRRAVRRQAYSIRRGVEAARLATPVAVPVFRRTPGVRYERAA